jgi:TonB family protein
LPRETAAKPTKAAAPALPARDVTAKSSRPTAAPELPDRVAGRLPDMPTRGREREMPKGQKELPSLSGAAAVPSNLPRAAEATRDAGPPPPPPSLGRPTGAPQGVGAVPSVEGDFPYQWYLTAVQRKVYEQWTQPLSRAQLQKVVIVFEIARNGEVARARVEKTSGDAAYDLAALRAVAAANPLPPLPAEFRGSVIRVHFGFEYSGRG